MSEMYTRQSYIVPIMAILLIAGCRHNSRPALAGVSDPVIESRMHLKPGSSYRDTMRIESTTAVFYKPDSLQYRRIRAANDSATFQSTDHELFYQMRNAAKELKSQWPAVKQLTVSDVRYLEFLRKDQRAVIIDLDSMQDMCGLFLFDPSANPQSVDMMNIGTEAGFYFRQSH